MSGLPNIAPVCRDSRRPSIVVETFGELNADGVYYLPSSTDSLITSILSLGTLAGALASAYIAMWFGRRLGLALYILIFCAGVAMQTAGYNGRSPPTSSHLHRRTHIFIVVALFSVGRVVAGFGVGGVSCVIPSYRMSRPTSRLRLGLTSATLQNLRSRPPRYNVSRKSAPV